MKKINDLYLVYLKCIGAIRGYLMFCLYKHKSTLLVLAHYNANVTKALSAPNTN